MCGRYALTLPLEALRQAFGFIEQPNLAPRYNIAPTQPIAIVRAERACGGNPPIRHLAHVRWGFLPGFAKNPKEFPLLFNARSEGVADKASFRNAVRRRRCLVPADGFYEWQKGGVGRGARAQPFLCRRRDGSALALAGLWETWTGPNGEEVDTACILTTAANAASASIHPRLPAVIEAADFASWLDPDEAATTAALGLLAPAADDALIFTPVSEEVNSVGNEGPELQRAATVGCDAPSARTSPEQASLF